MQTSNNRFFSTPRLRKIEETSTISPNPTRFEGALFDMDGVCYNSMPNHAIAWQRAMRTFGITMTEEDAYLTEGQRGTDTIKQLVKAQRGIDINDEEAQRMYDEKAREFSLLPTTQIMPGVLQFMTLLKSEGIKIGIVTGSGQRPLIERLQREFAEFVEPSHVVTAYDVTYGKPHPEPYLKGAQLLGVSPDSTIVVENAPLGVKAGAAAGCYTIGVNTGPLPDTTLQKAGARHIFKTFHDLCNAWPFLAP
jgi:HAD superfamily hydrolase (TIGR01509 family)